MEILNSLDALLITNPTNIRYLTGFVGAAPEEREAFALLSQNQLFLFINSLYLEAARKLSNSPIIQFSNNPIQVIEISREESIAKKLAEVLTGSRPVKRLGFEENDLTVAEYHKIMHVHKNVMLLPTKGRIEELRMIKREDEIVNIRAAAKITDQCFDFILKKFKSGVTEGEIAWEIEGFIRTRGAELAFSPIVAFGKNSSIPHYQPQSSLKRSHLLRLKGETLKNQDIALLDFGAKVNGYCSDMTRVVFVGKPKDEWKRAYETVHAAQQKALEYLTGSRPVTRSGAAADRIAREVIENAGFPVYPHSLGHGVGLAIHEAPRLTVKKDQELRPNMVVTIEPGIYREGSYGIRIEDLVVLKEDDIEVLSRSEKEIIIL